MIKYKFRMTVVIAGIAVLTAACTTTPMGGSRVDANFGDAVRSNIEGQIHDPLAAANPSTDAVEGTDGGADSGAESDGDTGSDGDAGGDTGGDAGSDGGSDGGDSTN